MKKHAKYKGLKNAFSKWEVRIFLILLLIYLAFVLAILVDYTVFPSLAF